MNLTLSNLIGTLSNLFKIGKLTLSASGVSTPKTITIPDMEGSIAVVDNFGVLDVGSVSTNSITTQLVEGSASPGGELVLTSTSNIGKGKIYLGAAKQSVFDENYGLLGLKNTNPDYALTIGSRSAVAGMATIGYEVASDTLSMNASNWTIGEGFSGTNNGNVAVTKNVDGLGSAVYTGTPVPWSGALYRIEISMSASVYGAQASFGGVNIPLSYGATKAYVLTENTNPFSINSIVNGSRFSVSIVTISEVGGNCGDIRAGGYIRLAGRLINASDNSSSGLSVRPDGSVKFDSYAKAVSAFEAPTLRGGTAAAGNLALSSTSDATKGKITFGTSVYDEVTNRLGINDANPTEALEIGTEADGGNVQINGTLGVELAPDFTAANWTLPSGYEATNDGGTQINKNGSGTGQVVPSSTGANPVVGKTYKVVIQIVVTAGAGATWSYGGTSGIVLSASGTYTHYYKALSANKLGITSAATSSRFTIPYISIKEVGANNTGSLSVMNDIKIGGRFTNQSGINGLVFAPNGNLVVSSAMTVQNTFAVTGATTFSTTVLLGAATLGYGAATNAIATFYLQNSTAATAVAPIQISPLFQLRGRSWDTSSKEHTWNTYVQPIYDAATSTSRLATQFGYNSITQTDMYDGMSLGSEGTLDIFGKTFGAETLTNGSFTGSGSWTRTGDMAYGTNNNVYTHSTGAGTLTQANATLATPPVANRWYSFAYTITSPVSGGTMYIGTEFSAKRIYLNATAGTYNVYFKSASAPTDFTIYVTSTAGGFTIDTMALKEVQSGDIIANGLFTGGGPDGIKITGDGLVKITNTLVFPKTAGKGIKVDTVDPTYPWEDIIGQVVPRTTGVTAPQLVAFRGGNVLSPAFAVNDWIDQLVYHMPHNYVPNTTIYIHIHWSHNGTAIAGTFTAEFYGTYAKGHNQAGEIFGAEITSTITEAVTNVAGHPRWGHFITEIALSSAGGSASTFDTDKLETDGLIEGSMKITSIPTITGGVSNLVFIKTVDIHYQSTGIGTKQRTPPFWN